GVLDVAMDSDGDFVVVWRSGASSGAPGIHGRRFTHEGVPQGPEFTVATATDSDDDTILDVARSAAGDFVVVWTGRGGGGGGGGAIYAQAFSKTGTPRGPRVIGNTVDENCDRVAVAMDSDGDYALVWSSSHVGEPEYYEISARRYSLSGAPTSEVVELARLTFVSSSLHVAMDADGDMAAMWTEYSSSGAGCDVMSRRLLHDGSPPSSVLRVNSGTLALCGAPSLAMDADGDAVYVFAGLDSPGSPPSSFVRRVDASGHPLGSEVPLSLDGLTRVGGDLRVSSDASGDFLVAWTTEGLNGVSTDVAVRGFEGVNRPVASTSPAGSEIVLSLTTDNDCDDVDLAVSADGSFVAVWEKIDNTQSTRLAGRLYDASGAPRGPELGGFNMLTMMNRSPSVAPGAGGGFVLAWAGTVLLQAATPAGDAPGTLGLSPGPGGPPGPPGEPPGSGDYDVYARVFDDTGAPLTMPVLVGTAGTLQLRGMPSVSSSTDGSFVVVWGVGGSSSAGQDLYGRLYSPNGTPRGPEVRLNALTAVSGLDASVAMDMDGGFVATWLRAGAPGSATVVARSFDATGAPRGAERVLGETCDTDACAPAVAADRTQGRHAVVWVAGAPGGGFAAVPRSILKTYFESGDVPTQEQSVVWTGTLAIRGVSVAMDSDGDFVVGWGIARPEPQYEESYSTYARAYTSSGDDRGPIVRGSALGALGRRPSVGLDDDGDFLVGTTGTLTLTGGTPATAPDAGGSLTPGGRAGAYVQRYRVSAAGELRTGGWHLLGRPHGPALLTDLLGPLWTQGVPGSDDPSGAPSVYRYNESVPGPLGAGYTPPPTLLAPGPEGAGYFVYVYADDDQDGTPDPYPKPLAAPWADPGGDVTYAVSYTDSSAPDSDDGWNLLANPFEDAMDWDIVVRQDVSSSVYVYDPRIPAYRVWNGVAGDLPNGHVAALQGFWLKAMDTDGSGSVSPSAVAPPSARVAGGGMFYGRTAEETTAPPPVLALRLAREGGGYGREAQAFVSFEEGAQAGLDGGDAYRLAPAAPDYTALFTRTPDGTALAVQALGLAAGRHALPLEVAALAGGTPAGGTFRLAWDGAALPDGWTARLTDAATGTSLDLTTAGTYSFTLDAPAGRTAPAADALAPPAPRLLGAADGLTAGRFTVVVDAATTGTGGETAAALALTVAPNPTAGRASVRYVLPEAGRVRVAVYDVLGREVAVLADGEGAAGRHEAVLDAGALAPGAYLVRLTSGDTTLVRRLTVAR
ncbi:MAG TPA: T9SS type A sorting domain-containing protein, partial [Rhodothermales bacterium]|nr:T9SS type A sorting domain-containing protein [Rhodothermales bacterium]